MKQFIQVFFWIYILDFAMRIYIYQLVKHSRRKEKVDLADMFLSVPFLIWAAYLIF